MILYFYITGKLLYLPCILDVACATYKRCKPRRLRITLALGRKLSVIFLDWSQYEAPGWTEACPGVDTQALIRLGAPLHRLGRRRSSPPAFHPPISPSPSLSLSVSLALSAISPKPFNPVWFGEPTRVSAVVSFLRLPPQNVPVFSLYSCLQL
jgi:hypothetical protein